MLFMQKLMQKCPLIGEPAGILTSALLGIAGICSLVKAYTPAPITKTIGGLYVFSAYTDVRGPDMKVYIDLRSDGTLDFFLEQHEFSVLSLSNLPNLQWNNLFRAPSYLGGMQIARERIDMCNTWFTLFNMGKYDKDLEKAGIKNPQRAHHLPLSDVHDKEAMQRQKQFEEVLKTYLARQNR